VEGNAFGKADCTHFVYIPFIFYPLWSHLFDIIKYRLSLPLESVSDFMKNVALKNGTLLKGSSLAVYYVENGKKRIFNDWGIGSGQCVLTDPTFPTPKHERDVYCRP